MIVKRISESEFNEFIKGHPQHSFYQTLGFVKRRERDGWETEILGFLDNDMLSGAGLFYKRKLLFNKYKYECLGGPIIDLSKFEESVKGLKEYLDKNNVHECMINPNLIAYHHNIEENIQEETNNFSEHKSILEKNGFIFDSKSDESDAKLNWFYKKDLDKLNTEDELLESFDRETKRLVGLSLKNNLNLEDLKPGDFKRLKSLLDMTADTKSFDSRPLEYFESLFESYNQYDKARFVVVTLDVDDYKKPLIEQKNILVQKIEEDELTNTKRSLNRAQQNKDVLNAVEKKLDIIKDVKGSSIDLCGGVFLYTDQELTYTLGGSNPKYFTFNGPQFLQWNMMLDALDKGIERYNFYGTRGSFIGRADEDGVYFFKKGFNGYLIQNFGFYDYTGSGLVNGLITSIKKLKSKIRG